MTPWSPVQGCRGRRLDGTTLRLTLLAAIAAVALAACTTPRPPPAPVQPIETTPPGAPVVRAPMAPTPAPHASVPTAPLPSTAAPPAAVAPLALSTSMLYRCVTQAGGKPQQTAIAFIPKVLELCRRHPEMGPCQYEREVCRRAGGRVFAVDGTEITRQTEVEYDKRVLRVRFRGD